MNRLCLSLAFCVSVFAADRPPKTRLAEVEDIQPTSYKAGLSLDPGKDTYSGSISIHMQVNKPVETIWLNQEKLSIKSAVLTVRGTEQQAHIVPGGEDFVGLGFDAPIPADAAVLTIQYTGEVFTKNSSGLFRQQESGNWYLFSQFETTDARAAFPCFDEPSYKTPWQLTLHIPAADAAIGNTPVESENSANGTKTLIFKETKPLPSYLVAFAVGPFEFVKAGVAGKNKVPVRIVVPKGKAGEAKYAAEVTAAILTRLEDYFGIPYPYEKADQVAVPDTSGWGAMENPGMVTYSQNIILADPKVDQIGRQRNYAEDAAHELAHQWFGDLVTTAWWDDIWLNEAFATWMERKLIAEWKPEWQTRVGDVSAKLRAEGEDSLISVRKIRQPILSNNDINNAFDNITYQKGASVIGMFENWMGPEEFRKGVQSYLKQYGFRATTAGDFLDSLSSASQRNVTAAFSTFLNQAGVPIVSVALDCNDGKAALKVDQQRFLPVGSKGSTDQTWGIPFCVRYGTGANSRNQCTLLTEASQTVELAGAKSCPAWVQANDGAKGYYRVDYKGGLLNSLVSGDIGKRLSAPERADLLGNSQALSGAGKMPVAEVLSLVETFHDDPDRYVLRTALTLALEPRSHLVPDNLLPNYRRFLLKNFQARAAELGWTTKAGESDGARLLRAQIVQPVATTAGDMELAGQAKELADKWFGDHAAVDPNLVSAVLGTAAYYGNRALFERMLAEFKNSTDRQIRRSLIGAMGSFRDPAAIEAGMNALIGGDIPFIQGSSLLFAGQGEESTRKLAFEFLKAHWDQVVARMPTGGGFDFGADLPRVGGSYCDASMRDELRTFFAPRVDKFLGAPRALDQTVEAIDLCIANKAAQEPGVGVFLAKY
jgi:alanyl aminopeptidase